MIEKQVMPKGLVRKNELAMMYFPNATSPKVANDNLRRWIVRCRPLFEKLKSLNWTDHDWYFTPKQVEAICEFLGEP